MRRTVPLAERDYDRYRSRERPRRNLPEVEPGSALWDMACNYFYYGWQDSSVPPPVILRILNVEKPVEGIARDRKQYFRHRWFLDAFRQSTRWRRRGNEKRMFHGTIRTCAVGDPTRENFMARTGITTNVNCCPRPDCNLCNIIQESFRCPHGYEQSRRPDGSNKLLRYGPGIYVTQSSNKAAQDEYQGRNADPTSSRAGLKKVIEKASPNKTVLLCRCLVGRPWYAKNEPYGQMQKPPKGFDSIIARPGAGRDEYILNFDETVVYRSDAICPWLLIVFDPNDIETEHPAALQILNARDDGGWTDKHGWYHTKSEGASVDNLSKRFSRLKT